jgi:crotonobetainyl-CoA:carnitine CoA-transferase CaiB-like acyl-CoA transferase
VLVQNLAPGAAARLGLSYDVLHEKYPALIVCDISGYDDDNPGPYRDKKAYDLLIQSESGFVSITGSARRAGQGRLQHRRHRCRHVCLQQHPDRPDPAWAHRQGFAASTCRCSKP